MGGWGGFFFMLMRLFGLGFFVFVGWEKFVFGLFCLLRKGVIVNWFGFWIVFIVGLFGVFLVLLGWVLGFGFELVILWILLLFLEGLMIGFMFIKFWGEMVVINSKNDSILIWNFMVERLWVWDLWNNVICIKLCECIDI